MKYDAFISYRRSNGYGSAMVVLESLRKVGLECFVDLEYRRHGNFEEHLKDTILQTKNMILILSEGSLDTCWDEKDYVRKEILTAAGNGVNIIPVTEPDFRWPEGFSENPAVPKEISGLKTEQWIVLYKNSKEYSIVEIILRMKNVFVIDENTRKSALFVDRCAEYLGGGGESCRIDMAFHAGAEWITDSEKLEILNKYADRKTPIRILLNPTAAVGEICSHMAQPRRKYSGFEERIEAWGEYAGEFPGNVTVRVAMLPILHRSILVRNAEEGYANVRHYAYGKYVTKEDARYVFRPHDSEYRFYADEFDYMWENISADWKEALETIRK